MLPQGRYERNHLLADLFLMLCVLCAHSAVLLFE